MPKYYQHRPRSGDQPIRFKSSLQNTILDVLRARPGWEEVFGENEWDFYWTDVAWMKEQFDHMYMEEHVRINHFRNHYEVSRKNFMVKNLKRLRRQIEREHGKQEAHKCDFFPTTFELPSEYHIFVEAFRRNPKSIWIMKPVGRSQGRGIFLFRRLKDIIDWKKVSQSEYQTCYIDTSREAPETYVVQRYIEDPYLIGGRKFDMRVYVVVTSYNPLTIWLYRSGFARFSNTKFSLESIDDNYVHLTNVAIQKTAPDYDPEKGCKWSTQQLRCYLTAKHGQTIVDQLHREMDKIFILSLQSVQKVMINDKHCFELYGYDILLDSKLKPWLLEINTSPSLTATSKDDYDLKFGLLNDVLNIVDMENKHYKEKRVGGIDLLWADGPVYEEDIGCYNDRKEHLRQLYQQIGDASHSL